MTEALRDELIGDPEGLGYPVSDQGAADLINSLTTGRTRNRSSMSGDEIAQQADDVELDALDDGSANNTADVKSHWLALCGRETINPFAAANVHLVVSIFGAGSQTVINLQAARVEVISRAQELQDANPDFPVPVFLRHVTAARM